MDPRYVTKYYNADGKESELSTAFGEISLSDEPDVFDSTAQCSSTVHVDQFQISEQIGQAQHQMVFPDSSVLKSGASNTQLADLLSHCQTKGSESLNPEGIEGTREESIPHPGSIMSLSTGSEESAVDDERFVKVKPCEIETSSSKASSQSGKDFEVEEQIAGLSHQCETLKEELRVKDEEYARVKLELEAVLLEKNVETESMSQSVSQVCTLKHELNAKDSELAEVKILLDEAIRKCEPYLPSDSIPSSNLQSRLAQIAQIARLFVTSMGDARDKEDEMTECINGYQAIKAEYEKQQEDYLLLKEHLNAIGSEETDRFKQELLTKDEDLFEIQTRFEEAQSALEIRDKLVEDLQLRVQKLESESVSSEAENSDIKEKLKKTEEMFKKLLAALKQKKAEVTSLKSLLEAQEKSDSPPAPAPPAPAPPASDSQIKQLKQQCLEKVRVTMKAFEEREATLKAQLKTLAGENSVLKSILDAKDEEIANLCLSLDEKSSETEQLMLNIEKYRQQAEEKIQEITTFVTTKDDEIDQILMEYRAGNEERDRQISDFSETISNQGREIFKLVQIQENLMAKDESATFHVRKLEQDLADWKVKYLSAQREFDTEEQQLRKYIAELEAEIREKSDTMQEAYDKAERKFEASLDRMRGEYELSYREAGMLRESEFLSDKKKVQDFQEILVKAKQELKAKTDEANELAIRNFETDQSLILKSNEAESLQNQIRLLEQELSSKTTSIERLEFEILELSAALEVEGNKSEAEERARKEAERSLAQLVRQREEQILVQQEADLSFHPLSNAAEQFQALQAQLLTEVDEKRVLERKVELLQSKISEIESSEIKSFEESFMLKGWVRQLELENLKYQDQVNSMSGSDADSISNPKRKALQDEVIRLINSLEERDKRCEQLTLEITRLLEERDGLQLKLSNVLKHNVALTDTCTGYKLETPTYDKEGLQTKLLQLEETNYRMEIDLKREREARRLVQEQLLFSQTSRVYRDLNKRNRESSSQSSVSLDRISSSPEHSQSDSGHLSPSSLDSGELLGTQSTNVIVSDPVPPSNVVHI